MSAPVTPAMNDLAKSFEAVQAQIRALIEENQELRRKTNNRKKLAPSDVRRIRSLYADSGWTQRELAEAFDVNPATVSRIVRGIYH